MTIFPFLIVCFWCFDCRAVTNQPYDTSTINTQTRNALINARRDPERSIVIARKALDEAREIEYTKGIADACYALGSAWLARYNIHDSATYYNKKALDIYTELNDMRGQARACYGLAYVYSFKGDLEESEKYGSLSLTYFEKAGDKPGMINAFSVLSYLAKQKKDMVKARELIEQAIETARSVNDTLPLADAINSLGNIYKDMALFGQAIDSYFEALNLWELKKDSSGIAIAYGSIALMYYFQKNWDKALEFNLRKMPLSEAAGNLWEVSKTCNNIASIYNSKKEYDSALIFLRKSLRINYGMKYVSGIATSYYNFANTFLLLHENDSAFTCIKKALSLADSISDPGLANYYVTLGKVQEARRDYSGALNNLLMAYNLAKKYNQPILVSECADQLSYIYHILDRNDLAYNYLREHILLQDSISNNDFLNKVTRLEIQHEYDKKQRAAEYARLEERLIRDNKIKQQKQYLNGLLILLVLGALVSYLYIRQSRLKASYTRIDLEQRLLRNQMNPHFIFNSLCTIQELIINGKSSKANTYLTKVARLMRNILENTRKEYIPVGKEIETIKLYLDIQQLRFEQKFDYTITVDPAIDADDFSVPPMLTQPCVENSIEHGILPGKKKGRIDIRYSLYKDLIRFEITDNGVGRANAVTREKTLPVKKSVSTDLISQRLGYFRKILHMKNIIFEITDLYENAKASGTKVIMMLPCKKIYTV